MRTYSTALVASILAAVAMFVASSVLATKCTETVCVSPCLCSATTLPYGWLPTDMPQMITVVFQGSVNQNTYATFYQPVFNGLTNPNGCQVGATYFLSHKYTDYTTVNKIYNDYNDLGVQALTGTSFQGKDETTIYNEIAGERHYIESFAKVPEGNVRGVQPPSLCPAGNNQYDAITQAAFDYDQSLSSRAKSAPYWPYSLDYLTTQDIVSCSGPSNSYPGIYEFPLNDFVGFGGTLCSSLGSCAYGNNVTDGYTLLNNNFARYKAEVTPFLINVDLTWLEANSSNALDLNRFLYEQLQTGNTWVVTLNQATDWFKTPTKLPNLGSLPSWNCPSRTLTCSPLYCSYIFNKEAITMNMCYGSYEQCPDSYPWIDNLPWLQNYKPVD